MTSFSAKRTSQGFPTGLAYLLASMCLLTVALVLLRSHLDIATPAFILLIPVVIGVVVGGFWVGVVGALLGFLAFDYLFIPPYYTLSVGALQNLVSLFVYVVVVVLVSTVVSRLKEAQLKAKTYGDDFYRLAQTSQALIGVSGLGPLLQRVTDSLANNFGYLSVAIFLPTESGLEINSLSGSPLTKEEISLVVPDRPRPASLFNLETQDQSKLNVLAMETLSHPVGLLVVKGGTGSPHEVELLKTFANSAALAIDQALLREKAKRTEELEELDNWRRALLGSVSHDLKTPLASIKASLSAMSELGDRLTPSERDELLETSELQTDRLNRLVSNLLDMARIEAGGFRADLQPTAVTEVVDSVISSRSSFKPDILFDIAKDLPLVLADFVLFHQALGNLLDNAMRAGSDGASIEITARQQGDWLTLFVSDSGRGVEKSSWESVFDLYEKGKSSQGSGLGLAIAKSFVLAQGGRIGIVDGLATGVTKLEGATFFISLRCYDPSNSGDLEATS
ncbi:MAG: DUF4118 domain-containing protein [Acidimicrobiaceae bacterium]|nr:DUF4118 domain-containing protein [Acidimicrobiaceae bacterium]